MSAPKFTAAELLAEANHQTDGAWIEGYREHDELAQMLRYAADVIERHEKALAVTDDLSVALEDEGARMRDILKGDA